MSTFVLIHGGFRGGWVYGRLAPLLRRAGHDVYTPTLTGLGERSHLLTESVNVETHVQDVVNAIAWEDLDHVILAGHSYGGMIITAVADRIPDRIASLVFLDAIIPADGKSVLDQTPPLAVQAVKDSLGDDGGIAVPPFPIDRRWVNDADRDWVSAKSTPQPLACLTQPVRLTGAHEAVARRVYIYAAGGAEEAEYRQFTGRDGCLVRAIEDSGHELMIDQPEALARVLIETTADRDGG